MKNRIHSAAKPDLAKIMSVIVSVLSILLGIAYIACAYHIYLSGGSDPYSREVVGKYLSYLLIPSVVLIISIVIACIASGEKTGFKNEFTPEYLLARSVKKNPTYTLDAQTRDLALAEQKKRAIAKIITSVAVIALLLVALVLATNKAQYKNEQLTKEILNAVSIVLPLTAASLGAALVCSFFSRSSVKRELELHTLAVKEGRITDAEPPELSILSKIRAALDSKEKTVTLVLRTVVGAAALALVIFGAAAGGMADVLAKAIKICTECIGLG